jgi:hypothetical protein
MIADSFASLGASRLFWMSADWSLAMIPPICVVCQLSAEAPLWLH